MADKTIIFKLELDNKQLTASAKEAEDNLQRLQPKLAELAKTSGRNTVEYAQLKEEVKKYTKQLNDNAAAIQINNDLSGKVNLTTVEQARAAKALSVAYNNLTQEERENTEAGKAITEQYKSTNEALQETGLAVLDGRRSVGLYEKSIRSVLEEIQALEKDQKTVSRAIGFTTKAMKASQQQLDDMGDSADKTTAEYKQLEAEIADYNDTLKKQSAIQSDIEKDLKTQQGVLDQTSKAAAKVGFVYAGMSDAANQLGEDNEDLSASFEDVYGDVQPLTARIGELEDRLYELALAGKTDTDQFREISAELVTMKSAVIQTDKSIDALVEDTGVGGLSDQFGALGDSVANLDFKRAGQQTAALAESAKQVNFGSISEGIKGAGSALVSLGKVVVKSPFFLLLGAAGVIIAFWDDISAAIFSVDKTISGLSETTEDYEKGAADASRSTLEVGAAFKLAQKGVISKEEALKTYNDTLGDSFGKATDLNEAEALFAAKTKTYIKAAGLRAQANALLSKAADEQAKALVAQIEFEARAEKLKKASSDSYFSITKDIGKADQENTKIVKREASKRAQIFTEEAEQLLIQAEQAENANGIVSESEKSLNDELDKLAKERADKAEEAAEKRIEAERNAIERIRELKLGNAELTEKQREDEINAVADFRQRLATLEIANAEELAQRLLDIEQGRAAELAVIDQQAKEARIATLESNLAEELKTLEGTTEQKTEQERLLREQAAIELAALDTEYGLLEVARAEQVEASKQALREESLRTEEQRAADRLTILEANLLHEETLLREAGATETKIAEQTAARRIEIARLANVTIQQDATKSDAEKVAAAAALEAELYAIKKAGIDAELAASADADAQKKQLQEAAIAAAEELALRLLEIQQNGIQQQLNALEAAANEEQGILADKLDAGVISQEKYTAQLKKIEVEKQKQEAKLKKEQFEKQKAADLISAGISVSKAIVSGYTAQPFLPVGLAMGSLAAVLGGVQLAAIASQATPAFAGGGKVLSGQKIGPSDGQPIHRSNGDNLLATVRKGEVILNDVHQRRAGGDAFFASLGVPGFAAGGSTGQRISDSIDTRALSEVFLMDVISAMPAPVVGVKDIIDATDRNVEVEQSGNIF